MESFVKTLLCVLSIPFASDAFLPRINLAKKEAVARDHTWITKIGLMGTLAKFLKDNPQYLKDQELTDFLSIVVSVNSTKAAQTTIRNLLPQLNFIIAMSEIQNANAEVDSEPLSSSAAAHFNAEQFKDGSQRLVDLRKELITALLNGDKLQHARNLAGQILHSLQDFYSNTNWIELGNQAPYDGLSTPGSFIPFEFTAQLKEATCKNCASTPVTWKDCSTNLITDKLTSGYRSGQDVRKPANMLKCSHGGRTDESRLKPATGGINKDTDSLELSPHARFHKAASDLAIEATSQFFDDVRETVRDDIFARFLNLKSEKSMALVIDVSGSMSDEIAQVKNISIEFVLGTLEKTGTSFTYILVPFNDPDWGPVTVTSDADVVIKAVNRLHANGGGDCPELGMTGLYNALLHCLPNSNIFYFSDADSKDEARRNEVMSLAKEKKVQLNFILSGSCSKRRKRDLSQTIERQATLVEHNRGDQRVRRSVQGQDLYRILATETGGQVLKTSKSNLANVVKVIDPLGSTNSSGDLEEVALLNVEESLSQPFRDVRYLLDVDSTLQNLIVILSVQSSPTIAVNNVEGNATIQQIVISRSNTLLITELTELVSGTIELSVTCDGPYSLQVTGSSPLEFTYQLMDVEDLERGTTRRVIGNPLRGHTLLLTLDFVGQQINSVNNLTLLAVNGTELETFRITQGKGIYRDSYFVTFVPTAESFRLRVSGLDNQETRFQRVKPTLFALGDVELSQNIANKNSSNAIFPGEMLHLGIKVSNTGDPQALSFSASDDLAFVQSVTPTQVILDSNGTSVITLSLLAPENSTYGTTSTVTVFAYQNSDLTQVINFIVLYVTVASKNPDVTAPSCEVFNSTGSCADVYGSSECGNSMWSAHVTFNDTGEGLLSISTRDNHNGNLSVNPFSRGVVNTSVSASFTSNCCNPKVLFVGLDLVGNMGRCYVSLVPDIVSLSAKPQTSNVSLSLGEDTRIPFSLINHGSKSSFSFHVTKSSSLLGYVFPFSLTMNTNDSREGHVVLSSYGENSTFERLTVHAVLNTNYVNRKRVTLFDMWVSVLPTTQPTSRPTATKHVSLRVIPPDRNEVSVKPGTSLELNFTVENLALPDTFSFHVSAEKPSVTGHVTPSPVSLKTNHSVACLLMLTSTSDGPPNTVTQLNVTAKSSSRQEFQVFSLIVKVDRSLAEGKEETSGKRLEMWHVVLISALGGIVVLLVVVACFVYCKCSRRSKRKKMSSRRAVTEEAGCIHANRWVGDVVLNNLP